MIVNRLEFLDKLKKTMAGVENGVVSMTGADTFIFHNGKIYTYNDVISVMIPFEEIKGVEGAIKAKELYKTISKFKCDEIEIESDDKTINIKGGKSKVEMVFQNFDFDSRLKGVEPKGEWLEIDTSKFNEALTLCKMNKNSTPFAGVLFFDDKCLSTDGKEVNFYDFKSDINFTKFWISDDSVSELIKINNIKAYVVEDYWVHFKNEDGVVFSTKTLLAENYPKDRVLALVDNLEENTLVCDGDFPSELFSAIDRAVEFGYEEEGRNLVKLTFNDGSVGVFSETVSGKFEEVVDCEYNNLKDIVLYVDSDMMKTVSKKSLKLKVFNRVLGDKTMNIIVFYSDSSKHILTTFTAPNNLKF